MIEPGKSPMLYSAYSAHMACQKSLQYVAVCCSVLQCVAVCCRVLPCVAVCCRVLPCVAVCCLVLRNGGECGSYCCTGGLYVKRALWSTVKSDSLNETRRAADIGSSVLVVVCCIVLSCAAAWCSVSNTYTWKVLILRRRLLLQCTVLCCSVLHCVAVCYSESQCIAMCCSVLQHVEYIPSQFNWHCNQLGPPSGACEPNSI